MRCEQPAVGCRNSKRVLREACSSGHVQPILESQSLSLASDSFKNLVQYLITDNGFLILKTKTKSKALAQN
jgi:hypothetical protein